jgi:hypothetical protein
MLTFVHGLGNGERGHRRGAGVGLPVGGVSPMPGEPRIASLTAMVPRRHRRRDS